MHEYFDHLEQVSMTVIDYKAQFHTLSRYSTTSIFIESEWIHKFMKGLDGTYQSTTTQGVVLRDSFQSIIGHAKITELII